MTQTAPETVVGLYSFPKSGNTWLRAIILGAIGVPMGPGTLGRYTPDTHNAPALNAPWQFAGRTWHFYKSHHKTLLTQSAGQPLRTDKVVYVHRHPLDVFVSYLNYVSGNVMGRGDDVLPVGFDSVEALQPAEMEQLFAIFLEHATLFPQNTTFGGLFEHVRCFRDLQARQGNVHIMRYEDLIDDFEPTVAALCDFLGLRDIDLTYVWRTAERRTRQDGKFFWKRQKYNFRNFLTEEQVGRFVARWGSEMRALGYSAAVTS